jgi:hypothetical protein
MQPPTIDLVDVAVDFLQSKGYSDTVKRRLDSLTGREGIVVRRQPSTVTNRYQDRGKGISYIYQVVVRRRDEQLAMEQCSAIAALLEEATLESINGTYRFIGSEVYTEPQELELEDDGFYAWEARIEALIAQ